jgi:hypothetical protein
MFDQIKQLSALMKNAGAIKERAEQMKAELDKKTVEGNAGAGAVRVTMTGKGRVLKVTLDQPLIVGLAGGDKQMIEDLIAVAINDANDKVQQLLADEMRKATGGLDLGNLSSMFGG